MNVCRYIILLLYGIGLWVTTALPARADHSRCDMVESLETLPVADRHMLRGVCKLDDRAALWRDSARHEYNRLLDLIERIVPRAHWEKLVLATLMPDGLFEEDDAGSKGKDAPSRTVPPDCAEKWKNAVLNYLRTAIPAYERGVRGNLVDVQPCGQLAVGGPLPLPEREQHRPHFVSELQF